MQYCDLNDRAISKTRLYCFLTIVMLFAAVIISPWIKSTHWLKRITILERLLIFSNEKTSHEADYNLKDVASDQVE